jgi:hypothetical protein
MVTIEDFVAADPDDDLYQSAVAGEHLVQHCEMRRRGPGEGMRCGMHVRATTPVQLYRLQVSRGLVGRRQEVPQIGTVRTIGFLEDLMIFEGEIRVVGWLLQLDGDKNIYLAEGFHQAPTPA